MQVTLNRPISVLNRLKTNNNQLIRYHNSDSVSFSGQYLNKDISDIENELLSIAQKLNIEGENKDEIIDKLIKTCTTYDKIGHGAEADVYPIPFSDLVLKVYVDYLYSSKKDEVNQEITPLDHLNKVRYKKGCYQILDRIHGADAQKAYRDNGIVEYNIIASLMPQEAYDNFLNRTCYIHKLGFCYDNFGKNMIIDYNNGEFVPIDICRPNDEFPPNFYKIYHDGSTIKINPIDCIMKTISAKNTSRSFDNVFLKIAKSVACDFKNFDIFDLSEIKYNNKTFEGIINKLKSLQEKKMQLKDTGLSKGEIKVELKSELEDLNNEIDKLYNKTLDNPKEACDYLNEIINIKYELSELEKSYPMSDMNEYKYIAYHEKKYLLEQKLAKCQKVLEEQFNISI